jgi:hypothetical protein
MQHTVWLALASSVWFASCRGEPRPSPYAVADDSVLVSQAIPLRLTLAVPPVIRAGDPVPLTLTVENISGSTLELYLTGRHPTADITVEDEAGTTVWHNLERRAVQTILLLKPLQAGETMTLQEVWDSPPSSAPGEYIATAQLLGEQPLQFPPGRFRLIAP